MDKPQFVYVMYISTSPEKLWNALIEPKMTEKYWQHENISDWKPGSEWERRDCDAKGNYPPSSQGCHLNLARRLVLTWAFPANEGREDKHSRVTLEIEPVKDVVRLTVTHDALSPAPRCWKGSRRGGPEASEPEISLEVGRPLPKLW